MSHSVARLRYLRGTDVLHGEQVDQYAALTRQLMRRGLVEPIGSLYSKCAGDVIAYRRYYTREDRKAARRAAWHAETFPAAYVRPDHAPVYGPADPRRMPSALVSDGVARPRIPAVRRFDFDDRTSADLERTATALLRSAGDLAAWNLAPAPYVSAEGFYVEPGMYHIDTVHRYTRQPQVAPDPVAFRGVARWEPQSVRYGSKPRRTLIDTGVPGTELTHERYVTTAVGRGYRFIGHAVEHTPVEQTRAHRKASTAPRGGRWVSTLGAGESTIRRRWSKATDAQRETARAIVNAMRANGTVTVAGCVAMLAVTPSERVTIVAGDETLSGGTFTLESFARRVALT